MWLKDVFGPNSDSVQEKKEEEEPCTICYVNRVNTMVTPCRHMCLCYSCAKILKDRSRKCPICRVVVTGFIKLDRKHKRKTEKLDPNEKILANLSADQGLLVNKLGADNANQISEMHVGHSDTTEDKEINIDSI